MNDTRQFTDDENWYSGWPGGTSYQGPYHQPNSQYWLLAILDIY